MSAQVGGVLADAVKAGNESLRWDAFRREIRGSCGVRAYAVARALMDVPGGFGIDCRGMTKRQLALEFSNGLLGQVKLSDFRAAMAKIRGQK